MNFTEEEKIKILADLIEIKSVNENEIEVANYLKKLFADYDIDSTIIPVTDTRVNLVAEIGSGHPIMVSLDIWMSCPPVMKVNGQVTLSSSLRKTANCLVVVLTI